MELTGQEGRQMEGEMICWPYWVYFKMPVEDPAGND